MSPLNFAILALRLIGIYFFVESVPLFSSAVLQAALAAKLAETPDMPQMPAFSTLAVIVSFAPAFSLFALSAILFFMAEPIAQRIVPPGSIDSEKSTYSFEDIQAIAFAVAGLLVLTEAFPNIGRAVMNLYSWFGPTGDQPNMLHRFPGDWTYSVGVIAQVIVGLMLVLSPKGIRNLWQLVRTAGTGPKKA